MGVPSMSQMSSYHFICVRYTRILNFEAKSYVRRIACYISLLYFIGCAGVVVTRVGEIYFSW